MKQLVARFGSLVTGILCGFDRIVFRGTLLELVRPWGMFRFLERSGVRLLDFGSYVLDTSERLEKAALADARQRDRPVRYLQSASIVKGDLARTLLEEHTVDEGPKRRATASQP